MLIDQARWEEIMQWPLLVASVLFLISYSLRGLAAPDGPRDPVSVAVLLAALDAERSAPGANLTTRNDSPWWAFVTEATVSHGGYHPVTAAGRLVAIGLMLGEVTLVGVVTATLASWTIERIASAGQAC